LGRETGHRWGIALALGNLGVAAYYMERPLEAGQQLLESLELFRMIEEPWGIALTLNYLANGLYVLGMSHEAERYACEALEVAVRAKLIPPALEALVVLATIRAQEGEKEAAIELLYPSVYHPASSHATKERGRRLLAELASSHFPDGMVAPEAHSVTRLFQAIVIKVLEAKQQ
jgi:tetratricopeptide (TPR) repeat protein